jgi:hypothetical protein
MVCMMFILKNGAGGGVSLLRTPRPRNSQLISGNTGNLITITANSCTRSLHHFYTRPQHFYTTATRTRLALNQINKRFDMDVMYLSLGAVFFLLCWLLAAFSDAIKEQ